MAESQVWQQIAIKSYNQQLTVARKLAGFKAKARIKEALLAGDELSRRSLEEGVAPIDPDPAIQRSSYVKRAAEALFMSVIFTGVDSPIIEEIRAELSKALDKEVEFSYPPGGRLKVVINENGRKRQLTESEQTLITPLLRQITSNKVDTVMQGKKALASKEKGDTHGD